MGSLRHRADVRQAVAARPAEADSTGRRTVSIFTTTIFGLADPKVGAPNQALINGAVCAMLDRPIPTKATRS
ncbi:hypothetical protein [Nonomuraea insulae]|uniref:Uncharacterized protein n=1 Tax=Nonomuraea insulae TaxID=1616787 RepID=A0ABW1CK22_9ACTN